MIFEILFIFMARSPLKLILKIFVALVILIIFGRFILKNNYLNQFSFISGPSQYAFNKFENLRQYVTNFKNLPNLSNEIESLKKENAALIYEIAQKDYLKDESLFINIASGIFRDLNKKTIIANVFNSNFSSEGYTLLLNKGDRDGIRAGDVIITQDKFLIGQVKEVFINYSRILVVTDLNFKATATVMSLSTKGIARGALDDGLFLDLISQADLIKEGDVIVTSGDDLLPPALIIGVVDHVETNGSQVFKKVRIKPNFSESIFGRVLVISLNND